MYINIITIYSYKKYIRYSTI